MLTVIVFGLDANLTEPKLMDLHQSIVAEVVAMPEFGIRNESEMNVFFSEDMMSYGLGEDINIVAVTDLFSGYWWFRWIKKEQLARAMVRGVKTHFLSASVSCVLQHFKHGDGFCSAEAGEQVPRDGFHFSSSGHVVAGKS